MSQSERNDLDETIDRAAQQLVAHEPSPRLYAAVMAEIRADSEVRRTPSSWRTWRWTLAGMSAAAFLAVMVLVWQMQRSVAVPALPAPPQMARIAAAPPAGAVSEAGAAVAPKPRRLVKRTIVAPPEIAPTAGAVARSEIDAKDIHVATIPVASIAIAEIPFSTIPVADLPADERISISKIGAPATR